MTPFLLSESVDTQAVDALLAQARQALAGFRPVSAKTARAYLADVDRLSRGRYRVQSRSSHYRLRAAWVWFHRRGLQALLDSVSGGEWAPPQLDSLRGLLHLLAALPPGTAVDQDPTAGPGPVTYQGPRPRCGKRPGLGHLPKDWRETVLQAAPGERWPVVAVLALTGCRPAELEAGVVLTLREDGNALVIRIAGAKVSAHNGQPLRDLVLSRAHPWVLRLVHHLQLKPARSVRITCPPRDLDRLLEPGRRLLLASTGYRVSAYSFRHQMAADLKSDRVPRQIIAGVLGHRSLRTAGCYGHPRQGSGGGMTDALLGIEIPHDPRPGRLSRHVPERDQTPIHRIVRIPAVTHGVVPPPGRLQGLNPGAVRAAIHAWRRPR